MLLLLERTQIKLFEKDPLDNRIYTIPDVMFSPNKNNLIGTLSVIDNKLSVLDNKLSVLDNKLLVLDNKLSVLDNKLSVLDNKLSVLDNKLSVLDNKLSVLDNKFSFSFDFMILSIHSIYLQLHLTTGADSSCLPGVWINPNSTTIYCDYVDFSIGTTALSLNYWYNFSFTKQKSGNGYSGTLSLNGSAVTRTAYNRIYSNVKVYMGDPWHDSVNLLFKNVSIRGSTTIPQSTISLSNWPKNLLNVVSRDCNPGIPGCFWVPKIPEF